MEGGFGQHPADLRGLRDSLFFNVGRVTPLPPSEKAESGRGESPPLQLQPPAPSTRPPPTSSFLLILYLACPPIPYFSLQGTTLVSLLQEVTDRSSPGVPNMGPRSVLGWPHGKLVGSSERYVPLPAQLTPGTLTRRLQGDVYATPTDGQGNG